MKFIYLDLETSGLDPKTQKILQFGIIKDGVEYSFDIQHSDFDFSKACPGALAINGFTEDRYNKAPLATGVNEKVLDILKDTRRDYCFVCINPQFDIGFLRTHFGGQVLEDHGVAYRCLDLNTLGWAVHGKMGSRVLPGLFRVEPEPKVHDALEGAKLNKRILEAFNQRESMSELMSE